MKIPKNIQEKAIDLTSIGLNEVAWQKGDALLLLDYFDTNSVFVLGGDVLTLQDGTYQHNYDNWFFEKNEGNAKDSVQKAKIYISDYPEGNYVFVIVSE
jgi:hypothetical protein